MALTRLSFSAVVLALVAAACGGASEPAAPGVTPGPRGIYSVGATVFGFPDGPAKLAAAPVAPLAGWLAPAAVPSPDRRFLLYNAWHELRRDDPNLSWSDQGISPGDALAIPALRLYDASTGMDEPFEEGAFSAAWRSDGALAYFKGAEREYRAAVPFVGDLVVRTSLDAKPEVWSSTPGRYIVAGWAGKHLLAYRESEGEALDLLAFDGPGNERVLAPGSALVAISPDGARVFVERGPAEGRPSVRVLSVADGSETAALDLTRTDPAVGTVDYAGDWRGDRVVAASASGLAVFRVSKGSIALEQAVRIPGPGIAEARFAGRSERHVTAWASSRNGGVFLDCDRSVGRCARLVPLPHAHGVHGFPVWRRPLYNPSRPLATG